MKRILFVAVLVAVLMAVGAVAAFAAPGAPGRGFGMMGQGANGMMGRGANGMMGGSGHMSDRMMGDDLEELLGIDHADIHAAMVAGKSLVQIAAEKGVTEDKLINTLLEGRKAALKQAVDAGKLSQDSADQMLKFMETNVKAMVEAQGMGMMGAGGMMSEGSSGHMGGMMGGTQGAPDADDASGGGSCHGGQTPSQQGTAL